MSQAELIGLLSNAMHCEKHRASTFNAMILSTTKQSTYFDVE